MKKEVRQKNVVEIFMLFILLGGLLSFCIYSSYHNTSKIDVSEYTRNNTSVCIDTIENNPQNQIIEIRGWAAKRNKDLKTVKTYVALKNTKTLEVYKISTIKEERKDVTLYFKDGFNYDHSGFFARIDKGELKSNGEYEICILYLSDNNTDFVETGKIIKLN